MRVFFGSAAKLLTDRRGNGEGLIAHAHLSALARRGHSVTASCTAADFAAQPPYEVRVTRRVLPSNGLDPVVQALRAGARARGGGWDVAHWLRPMDQASLLYPRSFLAASGARTPLVIGPVSGPWPGTVEERGPSARTMVHLARLLAPLQARRVARGVRLLTSTRAAVDALPREWRQMAELLPLGVDTEELRPGEHRAEAPAVTFVGSLSDRKGLPDLLAAWPAVVRAVPRAELHLVGDGPWAAAAREAGPSVHVHGPLAHRDTLAVLRRSRCFVLPSHGEPFGMALLEAMALGLACVATRAGGPREILADGDGQLVPVADPPALASALAAVVGDAGAAAELGAANRARAEERFSLGRVAGRLEQIYAEAAG